MLAVVRQPLQLSFISGTKLDTRYGFLVHRNGKPDMAVKTLPSTNVDF